MDSNQIKFLGACIILGCSILAIPIGLLAKATDSNYDNGAEIYGMVGVALAVALGLTALVKLGSSKDK